MNNSTYVTCFLVVKLNNIGYSVIIELVIVNINK